MIEPIESIEDPRLDAYARLTDIQLRSCFEPECGLFIGESRNVIVRAIDAGIRPHSLLLEQKWLSSTQGLIDRLLADDPNFPVFLATHEQLEDLTGYEVTRGALGAFYRPPLPSVEELCRNARRVAVLEDITNYTNVGAIFRSAAALGIDAVLVTPTCHDPLYRRAARVSMGTVFQVPWTRIGEAVAVEKSEDDEKPDEAAEDEKGAAGAGVDAAVDANVGAEGADAGAEGAVGDAANAKGNAADAPTTWVRNGRPPKKPVPPKRPWIYASDGLPLLKSLGFTTVAMCLRDDTRDIDDPVFRECERLAIVLGTEGDGLRSQTIAHCDLAARIPMAHGVDSLNVAAASAVAFWEFRARNTEC